MMIPLIINRAVEIFSRPVVVIKSMLLYLELPPFFERLLSIRLDKNL